MPGALALVAGRIHLGKMERSTQRLWASGVWDESLLVRNLGLAGSMVIAKFYFKPMRLKAAIQCKLTDL